MAITNIAVSGRKNSTRRSLRTTLFFEAFFLLAITVVMTAVAAFFLAQRELKTRTISELQSTLHARTNLLETTIARQREQIAVLGHDPSLTSLPSVTHLVGFREMLKLDQTGTVSRITGKMDGVATDAAAFKNTISTDTSTFHPLFNERGWVAYEITSPQLDASGRRTGTLVALFDPAELMANLFATDYLGMSAEVLLVTANNNTLTVLHTDGNGGAVPVAVDDTTKDSLLRQATAGQEDIVDATDYSGIPVLAAYRTMSSLGWTMIVQVDSYEITAPILQLAMNLLGTGLVLVCLLSLSMYSLARRIVAPLEELTGKLNGLEARHWRFRRSIFTGNELEVVDRAATDLTARLRTAYDHLEDLVRERTKELREKNAQDEAILENIEYGLLMTDEHGVIVSANRAAELLTGIGATDLIGQPAVESIKILDKKGCLLPPQEHPVSVVLASKEHFSPALDPEFSLFQPEGKSTAVFVRSTPIMRGPECLGVVVVLRDTTDERRIDRMKSEFITLVSHQLRTPLSSMRWYIEMLMGDEAKNLTDDQRGYVGEVALSNTRMVHLVNALLNVSRLQLGGREQNPETVLLRDLTKEIIDTFKIDLSRRKTDVQVDIADDAVSVFTDRSLLQLIIENLISNAIKYGADGKPVALTIRKNSTLNQLIITVTDQGIGIPELQQPEIFQKMFRATNARTVDTDGNGLGLYIARIAADSIGATLTFQSAENKGTTFTLVLPLEQEKI